MKKKWLSELEHGEMFNLFEDDPYRGNIYYACGSREDVAKHGARPIRDIACKRTYFCKNTEVFSYELIIKNV